MTTQLDTARPVISTVPETAITEFDIPTLTAPQRQGDVGIWPSRHPIASWFRRFSPVPDHGIAIGDSKSEDHNNHVLHNETGTCYWLHTKRGLLKIGVLRVPKGCSALLVHTADHDAISIGPGIYQFITKREYVNGTAVRAGD